jgi:preprotein translocase YajC subunit
MNDAELLSVVFVAVMVAFYLMFLRPIQKDQEKHRQQIRDLRVGDEVLTTSNFVATIRDIQAQADGPSRITLELADGVVVTALPAAILDRLSAAPVEGSTAPVSNPQGPPSAGSSQAHSTGSRPGPSAEGPSETGQVQA